MADEADIANDYAQKELERAIMMNRAPIAKGNPGECGYCEEYSPRLVKGACARCRDKYNFG